MGAELRAKLSLNTSDYDRAKAHINHGIHELGFGFGELQHKIAAMFTVGYVIEFGHQVMERVKEIDILSEQLGVSTTTAQAWSIGLEHNNQSAQKLALAITKIADARKKALLDPGGKEARELEFFGIKGKGLMNEPVEILRAMSDQMSKTSRSARELTTLAELLGPKMATALRSTLGEGLTELEEKYGHTSQVIDELTAKNIRNMEKSWAGFKRTLQAQGASAMMGFADSNAALLDIIKWHPEETNGVWNPFQRAMDHLVDNSADPEGEAGVLEKTKRLEAAKLRRLNEKQLKDEVEEETKAAIKPYHHPTHHEAATNLVRLGNFAFTRGGANPMETVMNRQLQTQLKIEANTRPNKSVNGGDSVPL